MAIRRRRAHLGWHRRAPLQGRRAGYRLRSSMAIGVNYSDRRRRDRDAVRSGHGQAGGCHSVLTFGVARRPTQALAGASTAPKEDFLMRRRPGVRGCWRPLLSPRFPDTPSGVRSVRSSRRRASGAAVESANGQSVRASPEQSSRRRVGARTPSSCSRSCLVGRPVVQPQSPVHARLSDALTDKSPPQSGRERRWLYRSGRTRVGSIVRAQHHRRLVRTVAPSVRAFGG
jgi:hypothetical protein